MIGVGQEPRPRHPREVPSHTILGRAEDILQERLGVDRVEAFALIRGVAERDGWTVLDVAEEVVRLRRLPAKTGS